jgi:hypothetical protein
LHRRGQHRRSPTTQGEDREEGREAERHHHRKCTGVSTARALPGACAGRTGGALATCIEERVNCRVCLSLNLLDDLAVDCDSFDDGQLNVSCPRETFTLKSPAEGADTPGTAGVTAAAYPKIVTQFGGSDVNLNKAMFTRFRLSPTATEPDAILILVPGFEGGANDFKILAENLIPRVFAEDDLVLEIWAYDRRSNQLETRSASTSPRRTTTPRSGSTGSLAASSPCRSHRSWSPAPTAARSSTTRRPRPHSSPIGRRSPSRATSTPSSRRRAPSPRTTTSSSAATRPAPGSRHATPPPTSTSPARARTTGLRQAARPRPARGPGRRTARAPLTNDTLDRIEAKFDGGLFGAVRDNGRCATAPRRAPSHRGHRLHRPDAAQVHAGDHCVLVLGDPQPRILAAVEPPRSGPSDPDTGRSSSGGPGLGRQQRHRQGSRPGGAAALPLATVYGGIGTFIDDDGFIAGLAFFVATSVGATGRWWGR